MNEQWQLNENDINLIKLSLREDLAEPYFDATTDCLFSDKKQTYGVKIVSKSAAPIVVSGLPVVQALLEELGQPFELRPNYQDGDILPPGDELLVIKSDIKTAMMSERVLLNFLRHMCAVASMTADFVRLASPYGMQILDTRKTMPGMRHLEKYAVYCGGGTNHRAGLYDAIMVKDNHTDLLGGMAKVMAALPDEPSLPVIIEVRSQEELNVVLTQAHKVTRVLLDNMNNDELSACVALCQGLVVTEASGNITLDRVEGIAKTGVNFASVGALTHSSGNVDLSMRAL